MTGTGTSHGCVSVINGIVCGMGAVIGIALETVATFVPGGSEKRITIEGERTGDNLARICVSHALKHIGVTEDGYRLTIRSEIPPSRGLKSSSSVCNAVIKAVLDEYGVSMDALDMIKLGVECAKEAKVTVTGSFDDACGCEIGGFIITDNRTNTIIQQDPAPDYDVVLCIPDHIKGKVPKERYQEREPDMRAVIRIAAIRPEEAMTMNGRIIAEVVGQSNDLMELALSKGAVGAGISGTGPAMAVLAPKGEGKRIASELGCTTIVTETR